MDNAINPFDEVKLKRKLKVTIPGYGERRNKRIAVVLHSSIYKKSTYKCKWIGCTFNEAINQLLYIWSKDENEKSGGIDGKDNQITFEDTDANKNIGFFEKIVVYGGKFDNRIDIALEDTIHKKTMAKCARIGCTFNEAANQLLHIWSKDEKEDNSDTDTVNS